MPTSNSDIKHQFYFEAGLYQKFKLQKYPDFKSIEDFIEKLVVGKVDGYDKKGENTTYDIKHDISSLSLFEGTVQHIDIDYRNVTKLTLTCKRHDTYELIFCSSWR